MIVMGRQLCLPTYNQENKAKIEKKKKLDFSVVLEKGPENTYFLAPRLGYICKLLVQ